MSDKSGKVAMTALEYHTHQGMEYQQGETYHVDPSLVDTLLVQRKAVRAEDAPKMDVAPTKRGRKNKMLKVTKTAKAQRKVVGGAKKK